MNAMDSSDFTTILIDGKETKVLSSRGVIIFAFLSWREDRMPKAKKALQNYCQYLAMHKYGRSASDIWRELERKNISSGVDWIKASHDKFVKDGAAVVVNVLSSL